jgi:hypothetical protein
MEPVTGGDGTSLRFRVSGSLSNIALRPDFIAADDHDETIVLLVTVIGGKRYPDDYKWSGVHFCF